MATITWLNKIDGLDLNDPQKNVSAADMNEVKTVVNANMSLLTVAQGEIDAHEALSNNPHSVTKAQIGLGNVDNTSDVNKPVSTATQTALDLKLTTTNIKENIIPTGTINGSNTAFTFPDTPAAGTLKLYSDGIRVIGGGVDYTQSGPNITMNFAPVSALIGDYRI